jgi:peptidoglycan hydrolase-like protein with peptidoglycan-binding domain
MQAKMRGAAIQAMAVVFLACGTGGDAQLDLSSGTAPLGVRERALAEASSEHAVPRSVLLGYAWQVGRLEPPPEHVALEAESGHAFEARYGWMHLSDAQVERASALLGVPPDTIREDVGANTRAAAALLRAEVGAGEAPDWQEWVEATGRLAGLGDPALQRSFGSDVLAALGDGLRVEFSDGEVVELAPVEGLPTPLEDGLAAVDQSLTAPGSYPPMKWKAAHPNNYLSGRSGGKVKYVIVHMTEGGYYGTLQWFSQANPYQSSTHYVIKSSNGEITQMVNEANAGWHAGNTHYSLNSIGIEHEGYTSNLNAWFSEAMYQSSAKLVCAIARRHGIPVDSQHIIGHFQVPNPKKISQYSPPATAAQWSANRWNYGGASNHFDPSYGTAAWKWSYYLGLVQSCVNAASGTSTQNPIVCSGSACWPASDLTQGDTGDRVYSLQTALVYLGYLNPGVALSGAGTFGPATRSAVSAFQTQVGLNNAGYYGPATATALGNALKAKMPVVPSQNLWVGMSGTQVTQLQKLLAQVGYDVPATGYYGEMTRTAVRSFQQAHGLPQGDGSYGALTRMALAAHFSRGF